MEDSAVGHNFERESPKANFVLTGFICVKLAKYAICNVMSKFHMTFWSELKIYRVLRKVALFHMHVVEKRALTQIGVHQ
jgi:hypothetical protein